jgi:hypothetical protein
MRRVSMRIKAICANAVELSIGFSQSFARRRHRPSQANMRSTTSRMSVVRGRLLFFEGGIIGAISAHSGCVKHSRKRKTSWLCSARAIAVQVIKFPIRVSTERESQLTVIAQPLLNRALRTRLHVRFKRLFRANHTRQSVRLSLLRCRLRGAGVWTKSRLHHQCLGHPIVIALL